MSDTVKPGSNPAPVPDSQAERLAEASQILARIEMLDALMRENNEAYAEHQRLSERYERAVEAQDMALVEELDRELLHVHRRIFAVADRIRLMAAKPEGEC